MGIIIPHKRLSKDQTIKLFSNPVPGIICKYQLPNATYDLTHGILDSIKTIRYSKTMLIGALEFWKQQAYIYYTKIKRIYYPLAPGTMDCSDLLKRVTQIGNLKKFVTECPDSFLFSHRYIQTFKKDNENQGLKIQRKLLEKKYKDMGKIWFQKTTMEPVGCIRDDLTDIEFTIFINERPYLQRSKIAEVGETDKGNVYIVKK